MTISAGCVVHKRKQANRLLTNPQGQGNGGMIAIKPGQKRLRPKGVARAADEWLT